jgi:transcriptional regulator with XRE-family HTH domain
MENSNYEQQARHIIAEIKEIIDAKGLDLSAALENTGIEPDQADKIFSGEAIPSLSEFLALCEISGIAFRLPSVETPDNPM